MTYTPTILRKGSSSLVAETLNEYWQLLFDGWRPDGAAPVVTRPPFTQEQETSLSAAYARPAAIIRSTASMSSWLDKVAAVRLGTSSHAKAVCIGDSTTLGVFNGATLSSSYPTALKRRLGLSLPVQDGLAIALPPSTIGMDSRYAPGGYSYSSGAGPAGASWVASPGAGSDLTFTPTGNVDTIDVWTYNTSSRGTIAVKIDGAAVASINCAVGNGWTRNTYTVTAGAHTVALAKPTVADVYILGVDAYLSTVRSVRVANWGVSGSATGSWTNDAGGIFSLSAITAYAPDLSVIMLGINDAAAPVSAATYGTRLSTLIDTCKATGSVVLVSPIQSNPATGRVDDEQAYRDKMYELAASKDVPLIDAFNLYGAYSTSEGLWADDLHLTAKGYARLGRMVYNGLMAV